MNTRDISSTRHIATLIALFALLASSVGCDDAYAPPLEQPAPADGVADPDIAAAQPLERIDVCAKQALDDDAPGPLVYAGQLPSPVGQAVDSGLGETVYLFGETLVVRDPDTHTAYLYEVEDDAWVHATTISNIGSSGPVLMARDRLIIGAPYTERGVLFSFTRGRSGNWRAQSRVTSPQHITGLGFAGAMAWMDDGQLLVGVTGLPRTWVQETAAYVMDIDEGSPEPRWEIAQKLGPPGGSAGEFFGWRIAVDGDRAAVTALHEEQQRLADGAIYMYRRAGAGWELTDKLTAPARDDRDMIGLGTALLWRQGKLIASDLIYHGTDNGSGFVHVFAETSDGRWALETTLHPEEPVRRDAFGRTMALSGDLLLISAFLDSTIRPLAGALYVYGQDERGAWQNLQKIEAGEMEFGAARFGRSVAADAETVFISVPGYGLPNDGAGSVHMYCVRR